MPPLPGCTEDPREPNDSFNEAAYWGYVEANVNSIGPFNGCRKVGNQDWFKIEARDPGKVGCYPGELLDPLLVEVRAEVGSVGTPLVFGLFDDAFSVLDIEAVAPSDGQVNLNASWPDFCGQDDTKEFRILVGYDSANIPAPDTYENAYTLRAWAPPG